MVKGQFIPWVGNVRYLGVHIDTKANFKAHAELVAKRADELTSSLRRIMPNTGGPKERAWKLLVTAPPRRAFIRRPTMGQEDVTRRVAHTREVPKAHLVMSGGGVPHGV